MSEGNGEFDNSFYDKLEVGMQVGASTDPHGTRPGVGLVCGVESQSVWIFFVAGDAMQGPRMGFLEDCWHIDDPRVKQKPDLINDQMRRGVFWLSENQEAFTEYGTQIKTLMSAQEELVLSLRRQADEIAELKKAMNGSAPKSGPVPRPARKGN